MQHLRSLASVSALLIAVAPLTYAQVAITPMVGGYVPASDVNQVSGSAANIAKTRDGTLSLGADLDFGAFRLSGAYATGTTIKNANRQDIGKGSVLATTADLVIRPIPRILVQPYIVAGAGEKFFKYDESPTLLSGGNTRAFALHGGLGADLMLGSVGVVAELTDFVSKGADDKWNVHDAFLMVGLKLRLGGK
jgi:hypothetical protein